jgi:predicted amidophosphoribosyltransferase
MSKDIPATCPKCLRTVSPYAKTCPSCYEKLTPVRARPPEDPDEKFTGWGEAYKEDKERGAQYADRVHV